MKYRFQWNFPIFFSPHDNNKLYTTSNNFHVTEPFIHKNCPSVYFEIFPYKVDQDNNLLYMKSISLTFDVKDVFLDSILLIGCGKMGGALLDGWIENGWNF